MRKLIAAMKISVDGKAEGPTGIADWVHAWSEDYGLMDQVDACVLGGRMYPGYEEYWTAIQNAPDEPLPMTGKPAAREELPWSRFAAKTPHYVLSNTLNSANWPMTRFLRSNDDVAALKRQPGKDIYLMGGSTIVDSLTEAGLVDELRLVLYPLIAGEGKVLFSTAAQRRDLELTKVEQLPGGRLSLVYKIG
jgi:dihydrofolate reductase